MAIEWNAAGERASRRATEPGANASPPGGRTVGAGLVLCGLASVALLAGHPGGGARRRWPTCCEPKPPRR